MLGRAETGRILTETLAQGTGRMTEALLVAKDVCVTRFANSVIHQNVAERTVDLTVRIIDGHRVGIATTSDLSRQGLARATARARRLVQTISGNGAAVPLPPVQPAEALNDRDPRTAAATPEARAEAVGRMCALAGRQGAVAAGAFITAEFEVAVANSLGTMAYHVSTLADLHTVMTRGEGSGYASAVAMAVSQIDPEAVAAEAIEKAVRGRDPQPIEPGEYEVVLEEPAVAEMLKYFGQYAFSATGVVQGTSFMSGRFGEPVLSDRVTIWDDGLDPQGLRQPFDFEGVPKQKVRLVDGGVAAGVVHDTASAAREQTASTGHALPPTFTYLRGPYPLNMFMAGGAATRDEMVRSIKRGIWVSRFHYTAVVDPKRLVLTGLTRDGTFLIEDGRLAKPLRNLRFAQDCVAALGDVDMVGRTTKVERTKLFRDFFNVSEVPALKIRRFAFTGLAGA